MAKQKKLPRKPKSIGVKGVLIKTSRHPDDTGIEVFTPARHARSLQPFQARRLAKQLLKAADWVQAGRP